METNVLEEDGRRQERIRKRMCGPEEKGVNQIEDEDGGQDAPLIWATLLRHWRSSEIRDQGHERGCEASR